jgi:hypothetical protein
MLRLFCFLVPFLVVAAVASAQTHTKSKAPPLPQRVESKQALEAKAKVESDTRQQRVDQAKYYVGSSQSNKYHLVDCKWAKRISPKNLVKFKTVAEAKKAGYVPCKVCKPPEKD